MEIISGRTRKKFLVTKGILQGDTLAPFVFIIVLDYILRATESSNCGVKTHSNATLQDLVLADGIVLLDSANPTAMIRHFPKKMIQQWVLTSTFRRPRPCLFAVNQI